MNSFFVHLYSLLRVHLLTIVTEYPIPLDLPNLLNTAHLTVAPESLRSSVM